MPRCVQFFVTPWTVACQAPQPMEFSRQEYRSGLPFPSQGDLPDPGIEPVSLASPALVGGFFTTSTTWEDQHRLEEGVNHYKNRFLLPIEGVED